ncbi:glucuronosyltransferase [Novosphingobium sp.]|uniref:glucuronosyltransferase n=1 Tax=Novosphingobium sp. TaxID=1874826 RepID=UPI003D0ADE82
MVNSANKPLRLLAVASAGGHWIQLCRLRPLFDDYDVLYVTTLGDVAAPSGTRRLQVMPDASRSEPFRLALLWLRLLGVMVFFRPQVVVTTGAAPGLVAIQIGKMFGSRTVWIDSIANSEQLSMSGMMAERLANLRLTQWEHLADPARNVQYFGKVI